MIIILSPSKTMHQQQNIDIIDCANHNQNISSELSALKQKSDQLTQEIINSLKKIDFQDLKKWMSISDNIANKFIDNIDNFSNLPKQQAIFAYTGDVYKHLNADSLSKEDILFANQHLRIISGLYGLINPLDYIKEYRLEMKLDTNKNINVLSDISNITSLLSNKNTSKIVRFSDLWQKIITEKIILQLNEEQKNNTNNNSSDNKIIINLASNEYYAALDVDKLKKHNVKIININFQENRNGQLKTIALNSKRARGAMANYIITNHIDDVNHIKSFDKLGYNFDISHSTETNWLFIKN